MYARYERGLREIPVSVLLKLANYNQVSVDYILERTDRPAPYDPKVQTPNLP